MVNIIPFTDEYLQDIRDINVSVSTHPNKPIEEKKLCQHLYIDYYVFYSKENCFVAIDENKECVGYIICEPNFSRFKNHILYQYLPEAKKLRVDFEQRLLDEIKPYEKWNKEYPAHMHMDVKPGHQHQGIGTMLIQREMKHLQDNHIKGIMLQCSKTNQNANAFYQKNGLELIDDSPCNIRGKKL